MNRLNLKELAQLLGVSTSTVSKALKDSHEIGYETKKRIKAVADKLNYKPNASASSLRGNKSKTIGVVVPSITNSFCALAIDGIESEAKARGYHVLIYITYGEYETEVESIRQLHDGRVDGILLSLSHGPNNFQHLQEVVDKQIPFVLFDRVCEDMNIPWVTLNNYESGFLATEHLIKNGCKRIAYLFFAKQLSTTSNRLKGYLDALKKYDIGAGKGYVIECTNNDDDNHKIISHLLSSKDKPDGIFSSIEKLALNTYEVCNAIKVKIPSELKIISFSNLHTASLLNPSLSTMTPDAFYLGKKSAEILFENIDRKTFGKVEQVMLPVALVGRESSKGIFSAD